MHILLASISTAMGPRQKKTSGSQAFLQVSCPSDRILEVIFDPERKKSAAKAFVDFCILSEAFPF